MNANQDDDTEARSITLRLLGEFFQGEAAGNITVRLWEGTTWPDGRERPVTIILRHPGALRAMFLPGTELGLAEAYLHDDFDIQGDIPSIFDLAELWMEKFAGWSRKLLLARDLMRLPAGGRRGKEGRGPAKLKGKRHSIGRDQQAITYHYDVSNDFYALWLDRRMVYSCAYFVSPSDELDAAQERKLDYICRKLRLKPGQRLLDIGCGWGGLTLFACENYGVNATGITLSRAQAEYVSKQIIKAGLEERCRVQLRDYRKVEDAPFDALVSVGMFEHVGEELLPEYFQKAMQLLKPGGVFLNHGIAVPGLDKDEFSSFSAAYVFPDGELETISTSLRNAEENGFEVRDVESLREHYALTLRHWVRRLEQNHEEAMKFVDEPTYRVWRLYMSGSVHGFETGRLNVYQSLLVRPAQKGASGLPLTRSDWYH